MKRFVFSIILLVSIFAQSQEKSTVLVTISGNPVTVDEFMAIYQKNNNNAIDNKTIKEYLDLFINYKLKVIEAEQLKIDTIQSFIAEFNGYVAQLEQPYFTDTLVENKLIDTQYERLKSEIHASHILVNCDQYALPSDTLAAYNKIMKIRNRIVKGEKFDKVAAEVSDDPNAKKSKGELGYFTAMQMIYPFETAVYNLSSGSVSMPIRTVFGYHLVKVWEKRPSRGQIKVAHIMFAFTQGSEQKTVDSLKKVADQIYVRIKNGESFAQLAQQNSMDRQTAEQGGELPWFASGQMVPEFEDAAFSIKEDTGVCAPIKTTFGWHIIKKLGTKSIPSKDEVKEQIKSMIQKDERAEAGKKSVIEKIKKENSFVETKQNLTAVLNLMDSTFYDQKWIVKTSDALNAPLFSIAGNVKSQMDFAKYMLENQTRFNERIPFVYLITKIYKAYVDEQIIAFERTRLAAKYPEYKQLVQEYHDGILLFNLSDEKVWSKAMKDSAGLEAFYKTNNQKYLYGEREKVLIVSSEKEDVLKKAVAMIQKDKKGKLSDDAILKKICPTDSVPCLIFERGLFEKGVNPIVDTVQWKIGFSGIIENNKRFYAVNVIEIKQPEPKSLDDSRGMHISDYQNYLETQWISDLRKRNEVKVDDSVLNQLINQGK